MKKTIIFLSIFLTFFSGKMPSLIANELAADQAERTEQLIVEQQEQLVADQFDYQNFNHGYYPNCDRCGCNPCGCPGGCSAAEPSAPDQLPPPTPPPASDCSSPCEVPPPVPAQCVPPPCAPAPCAASVGKKDCCISVWAIGIAIAALCAAAAIIVSSGNGHASSPSP